MSSSYRLSLERWLSELDINARSVLDIGGAQLPVIGRTKTWDVEEYVISDLQKPHVTVQYPDVEFDLNYHDWRKEMGKFDIVFCLEVFEYIWNPAKAMINIAEFTRGKAYVSFPFAYPLHNPMANDYLRYTEYGIRKLAEVAGLKVVQLIPRRPETQTLVQFYRAERLKAVKGYDHNVLGWIVEFTK